MTAIFLSPSVWLISITRRWRNQGTYITLFCCQTVIKRWHPRSRCHHTMTSVFRIMTSSNVNIFCVTGPLCGEFTGDRWIPLTKASDLRLNIRLSKHSLCWCFEMPSRSLWRYCNEYWWCLIVNSRSSEIRYQSLHSALKFDRRFSSTAVETPIQYPSDFEFETLTASTSLEILNQYMLLLSE